MIGFRKSALPYKSGWIALAGLAMLIPFVALAQTPTETEPADKPQQTETTQENQSQVDTTDPPAAPILPQPPIPDDQVFPADRIGIPGQGETETAAADEPRDPKSYGWFVAVPAIVAIILAILLRQVVPALVVAVFTAAYMLVPCQTADSAYAGMNGVIAGFRLACEEYILGAIVDSDDSYGHMKIILFTLVIGFMVGVIGRNGGTRGMVTLVAGKSSSRRRTALTTWLAGLVVFFDDYANTMIVGPTMRSVFDKVKLSRAKLAYIIDSTAAPVASIALIGTWVGAEIGYIQQGLDSVRDAGAPAFLVTSGATGGIITGMDAFIRSIPYRFYPILALFFVFLLSLMGRDFGPMRRAESKPLSKIEPDQHARLPEPDDDAKPRWWLALVPILVLVGTTVTVLIITGAADSDSTKTGWQKASDILSKGDAYLSIFYGAFLSALTAVLLTIAARACRTRAAMDAGLEGMNRMFSALVILVLAWALSAALQELKLGEIVAARLEAANFQPQWLPLTIFISAAGISFATGTSWGTMGILCPLTVEVGARLAGDMTEPGLALNIFYASVGSVLAGAIFGDHCSPISDTTVLSSVAAGCSHEEHVWTQLPYALVVAVAAMGLGDVMCSVYKQPWYYGLAAGAVFLVIVVFLFGRKPRASFDLADTAPPPQPTPM